jgi:hypothetical protein
MRVTTPLIHGEHVKLHAAAPMALRMRGNLQSQFTKEQELYGNTKEMTH